MPILEPSQIVSGSASLIGSGEGLWWYMAYSGMALAASSLILAFIYIWASVFRNPQLTAYVKAELLELGITAILIPVIIGLVAAMSTLTIGSFVPASLIPEDAPPPLGVGTNSDTLIYDAAAHYYQRVENDMSGWLELNYILNMYVDQVASVTPYARPLGVGLVSSPMAGLASPIKQLLYNTSTALSLAFIINHAQLVVYVFAMQAFLKYYLPIGVFLRCFTPTRRLGGTLIGVAIAFLFIFPAISTITYTMFYSKAGGPLVTFRGMLTQFMSDGCESQDEAVNENICFSGHFRRFYSNNFTNVGRSVTDLIAGAFGGIGNLLQSAIGNLFLLLLIFPASIISWAFAVGFVVPAFNVIIFTQAAKSLSKSFGEEVDISSLTRMI